MKKLALFFILALFVVTAQAQSNRKKKVAGYTKDDYEISCIGVGTEGTKLIAVYGYGKNPDEAARQAKVNAVHGIIFRGAGAAGGGCQGIKPLAKSQTVEQENSAYFSKFFSPGGAYLNFVGASAQEKDARDIARIDNRTYKVGIVVSVSYDALRNELERAGVIRGLSSGF